MQLSFLGAAGTVTGSKYLLYDGRKKFLIDCGLFQGLKELRLRNWDAFPVVPNQIEALILTHAHLDHSGYIPLLIKKGFKGTIYATRATRDLCKILLPDSGRIQEDDAKHANYKGFSKHKPALPLYTAKEAEESLKYFRAVDFDKEITLSDSLSFHFTHAGHILGSAFVTLKNKDTTLVFSGDLGRMQDPILKPPEKIEEADFLVLESTYGDRLHPKIDILDTLAEIINNTVSKNGTVVIPAFAVGRAQSVLYYLRTLKNEKRIPDYIPIYLDSPMAQDATDLLCQYDSEHNLPHNSCERVTSVAKYVQNAEESKKLNTSPVPSIILSASGMAEGGRVLYHIKHYAPHPESTILFVGFQAAGTRGDRILKGEREVKIHGQMIPVRARIENLDVLSSHADYEEILQWLKNFKKAPKKVFLTHGEPEASLSLKRKIEEAFGWNVMIPDYLQTVDLSLSSSTTSSVEV